MGIELEILPSEVHSAPLLVHSGVIEPIHVVNVSLNVNLNDNHQMLKHQSFNPFVMIVTNYVIFSK